MVTLQVISISGHHFDLDDTPQRTLRLKTEQTWMEPLIERNLRTKELMVMGTDIKEPSEDSKKGFSRIYLDPKNVLAKTREGCSKRIEKDTREAKEMA